jgi:16S rRNA (adenine1518-N6/adenine1519-N6)-dimethyltransferase
MTLMFQREVADRLVARPRSKTYGRLSVIVQALASAEIRMELPARAFTPPPKVESAVVRIVPKPDSPTRSGIERLQQVTAAAFGQRRKMLRTSLRPLGGEALCSAAGLDPTARADAVEVEGYLALAAALEEGRAGA